MRIALQILIVVMVCLSGGIAASFMIWQQYQNYEQEQQQHQANLLTLRDVEHVSTMTSQWLVTIDLFFSGSQSYLAQGIIKQTTQLTTTLERIQSEIHKEHNQKQISRLIEDMGSVRNLIQQAAMLRNPNGSDWNRLLNNNDELTSLAVERIESLHSAIHDETGITERQVAEARAGLMQVIILSLSLYIAVIVFVWRWAAHYIARPLQKLTRAADKTTLTKVAFVIDERTGPREVRRLNTALQILFDRLDKARKRADAQRLEAMAAEQRIVSIMRTAADAIIITDITGQIENANQAAEQLFNLNEQAVLGKNISEFIPELKNMNSHADWESYLKPELPLEMNVQNAGEPVPVDLSVSHLELEHEEKLTFIIRDISLRKEQEAKIAKQKTALEQNIQDLNETRAQLVQSEKMAAVGQLAAGVAHEINNPVGFISSNVSSLKHYLDDIKRVLNQYGELLRCCEENQSSDELQHAIKNVHQLQQKVGLTFIIEDLDDLFSETIDGTARVKKIVGDLLEFSHTDKTEIAQENINELIDKSINIASNELKYKVELVKEYGELETLNCNGGKLSQVFLILLVNAAQAMQEKGKIWIRTQQRNGHIQLEFEDNGCGIPQDCIDKIYDPFFTTKEVGQGTGLGLNVAQNIISHHQGEISVKSEINKGTIFTIILPIQSHMQEPPGGEKLSVSA